MGWLIALGVIAALALLPLGISARYDAGGAVVRLIAGPVRIRLYPRKKKDKKPQKEEATEAESRPADKDSRQPVEKKKSGGSLKDFLPLVRVALDFLGDLRRKLRVKRLEMKLILASDDPADLGISYGRAWAALGNLWPRLEKLFVIKKRDVEVECDFTAQQTLITARLDITITLGRLLVLAVRYGVRALKEFLKLRKQSKGGATI